MCFVCSKVLPFDLHGQKTNQKTYSYCCMHLPEILSTSDPHTLGVFLAVIQWEFLGITARFVTLVTKRAVVTKRALVTKRAATEFLGHQLHITIFTSSATWAPTFCLCGLTSCVPYFPVSEQWHGCQSLGF